MEETNADNQSIGKARESQEDYQIQSSDHGRMSAKARSVPFGYDDFP
jgi:hypothetical protein